MRSIFLLPILLLACGRGSARISESCDCNDRTPEPDETGEEGSDSETGVPPDDTSGGSQQTSEWLTYTVICSDEDAAEEDGYTVDVEVAATLPSAVVQVWGALSDDVDTSSCDFAVAPIAPPGVSASEGLNYQILGPSTIRVACRKYGTAYWGSPDWCDSSYVGWGPSSYTIHVLPLSLPAR